MRNNINNGIIFGKLKLIWYPIMILLILTSVVSATDKSISDQNTINDSHIKQIYPTDIEILENFENELIDMEPQEIAKNIEIFSNKYKVDNTAFENIPYEKNTFRDDEVDVYSSSDEIIALVKFSGKINIKNLIELYKLGVTPYSLESKNTILAKVKTENVEKLRSYSFIKNIKEYRADDKIKQDDKIKINQIGKAETGRYNTVKIHIWPLGKGKDKYVNDLKNLGIEKISYDIVAKVYYVEMLPSKIDSILNLKWVKKINIPKEIALHSLPSEGFEPQDSREIINAPLVWPSFTGNNINVGVLDTGIWDNHPDFAGGIVHSVPDNDGHGTHVSGIIASRGTRDIEGQYDGRGVAYGSDLYVLNNNLGLTQFNTFRENSINIVSNSWGFCEDPRCITRDFSYNDDTKIIDSYVENNGMTIIFSAGNEGQGQGHITNPGTSKNAITVGAISNTIGGDSGGVGHVADYSSRGPTATSNRLKPDIVAPGGDQGNGYYRYGVVSTNAQDGNGNWLDNVVDRWPTDSHYTRMVGTSMAAPHISGVVALINEAYQNSFSGLLADGIQPRDFKALLIANAIPLKGYGADPNNGYANTDIGYGLTDAYFSIFDRTDEKQTLLWGHGGVIETTANTQDWNINLNGNERELVVALAYEDNEGQIDPTHVLKDDLDLRITSPNGNVFTYTLPAGVTSEEPEEKIVIENPSNYGIGTWNIRVEGTSWDNWLNPFEAQRYTVLAIARYVRPSLGPIEVPSDIVVVNPGASFTISPSIRNNGGLTTAGVTAKISTNAVGFSGDINKEAFVGNIVGSQGLKSVSFDITAPSVSGVYNIDITAKGINHDLNTPDKKTIKVYVGVIPPDYFGYTFIDNNMHDGPTYDWIDITSTGTMILPSTDDYYVSNLPVGFFFNYYGTDYSQVSITNNGIVLATGGTGQYINQPIGSSTPHNFISPFWDDLVTWGSAGAVYYKTIGTAPNRMFVVEWYDNQHYSSSTSGITFEAILYEGTNNMKFQYKDVEFGTVSGSTSSDRPPYDKGGSATVGIEGPDGRGLQYSYNEQTLSSGMAILFKFPAFSGTNMYISKSAPANMDHGNTMTYTLYYNNFGGTIASNVILQDTLPSNVEFISASDGGTYNSGTRKVTWNIGSVAAFPSGRGSRTITVMIPTTVPVGTVVQNTASISTSTLETRYDDNSASISTTVTGSNLPQDVSVGPTNGNSGGTPSVVWHTPITFSYHSSCATGIGINIHFNDGGSDITGTMTETSQDTWVYTTSFSRTGGAIVTYSVSGCTTPSISFNIYIDPAGYIYDLETGERIADASVWLQRSDGQGGWENVPTGQAIMQPDENPLTTGTDGQYQWDVIEGSYRVHVEAPSYSPADSIVVNIPPPVTDLHVGLSYIDTIDPTIESVIIYPKNTTAGATIDINVSASDNRGVVEVTADGTSLVNDNGFWKGGITASSTLGSHTITITVRDQAGNSVERTVEYKVVSPTGSLGVGVSPKITTISSGNAINYIIKIKSMQNFDDKININITQEGLSTSYRMPPEWFSWNSQTKNVPSNSTINIPLTVNIPSGTTGKKAFKVRANSTSWITSALDSGVITIS